MPDVPEIPKDIELEPTPRPPVKPKLPYDKPVAVEKAVLPAKDSTLWDGARHFLFGMLQGGGGALAALATAGMMGSPAAWPIVGACALGFGAVEAGRKIAKRKSGGKDWTDVLYRILELVLKFLTTREVKK